MLCKRHGIIGPFGMSYRAKARRFRSMHLAMAQSWARLSLIGARASKPSSRRGLNPLHPDAIGLRCDLKVNVVLFLAARKSQPARASFLFAKRDCSNTHATFIASSILIYSFKSQHPTTVFDYGI